MCRGQTLNLRQIAEVIFLVRVARQPCQLAPVAVENANLEAVLCFLGYLHDVEIPEMSGKQPVLYSVPSSARFSLGGSGVDLQAFSRLAF